MVTEEPSVIAASSHGGGTVKSREDFKAPCKAKIDARTSHCWKIEDVDKFRRWYLKNEDELLEIANQAHPSIVRSVERSKMDKSDVN